MKELFPEYVQNFSSLHWKPLVMQVVLYNISIEIDFTHLILLSCDKAHSLVPATRILIHSSAFTGATSTKRCG